MALPFLFPTYSELLATIFKRAEFKICNPYPFRVFLILEIHDTPKKLVGHGVRGFSLSAPGTFLGVHGGGKLRTPAAPEAFTPEEAAALDDYQNNRHLI